MRFAPEGWPFVLPWFVIALLLWAMSQPRWATACVALGVATLLFFRDPTRSFDGPADILLAPADGKVLRIEEIEIDLDGKRRMQRIVTFLSVFNVHVQRTPIRGEVVGSEYRPGSKLAAFNPRAGEVNEQQLTLIRTESDDIIGVIQIAGLLARRVVGYLKTGDTVERGQHLGLIKFGSRVDLLVPVGYIIEVEPGDRVRAGETPMARGDNVTD